MSSVIEKADELTAKAIDKSKGGEEDDLITLSTGVILRAKSANPMTLIRVMTANPRPQPPVQFIEVMGREMENPDHPDYIKRVEEWQMQYNSSMLNALIGLGTELVSKPKGIEAHTSDKWIADYKSFGLRAFPESNSWRYITWIMFVAAPTEPDTKLIAEKVRRKSGVKEADVQSAETFPERK